MPIPFEFVIAGRPVSQQTRRRELVRQWTGQVANAARHVWGTSPPVAGPLMVSITYFFDNTPLDVDNIPKPILDALKGMVYVDDSEVFDLLCRKRDIKDEPLIENGPPDLTGYVNQSQPVLHIAVTATSNLEVILG